jgi:hypothetical protein
MITFHAIAPDGRPENYPDKLAGEAMLFCAAAAVDARRRPYKKPWVSFLVTDPAVGTVGGCGFANMPDDDARVEIMFECFSAFAGRGYEAAIIRALGIIAAKAAPGVQLYTHTSPHEGADTEILEQSGFHYVGMVEHEVRGLVWLWERGRV